MTQKYPYVRTAPWRSARACSLLHTILDEPYEAHQALAAEISARVANSEDARSGEGRRAFAEKRKPVWKAR